MSKSLLLSFTSLLLAGALHAQFTEGNIAVFMAASATSNNTTASIVELSPVTAAQTAPNLYPINGTTGTTALRFSGSATSTGYLSSSDDNSLLSFSGANATTTTGNSNTITARGVGTFNVNGVFNLAATYTGISGNQARSATSTDNVNWYIADQGGMYTNNAAAPSPAGNVRAAKSFGGTVYVSTQSTTVTQVNTLSAATGATLTGLPGLSSNNSLVDFYMIQSGSSGTTFDVLYVLSTASISKYSLVTGSWVSNGSYATTFGGFGLLARAGVSGTANLFVTTGTGATAANTVIRLQDDAGYNTAINITTANNVTLYTAPAGTTLKGVANAPFSSIGLAITLSNFAATQQGSSNLVTWSIAEKSEGDYVVLERSADGKHFATLTTTGINAANNDYQFLDKTPFNGNNYYRLALATAAGSKTYSKVVNVNNMAVVANVIKVYPNPVTGTSFQLSLKNRTTAAYVITVADYTGKVIASRTVSGNSDVPYVIELPAAIANGTYYLHATNGTEVYTEKIVVRK